MAKHRAASEHSVKVRTAVAGAITSGALLIGAPAGMAMAKPSDSVTNQVAVKKTPEKEIGAAVNKYLAKHPKTAVKVLTFVSKLPPKTQQEIGKIAADFGIGLGGAPT
ncbi:hypothetical protein [Mycolicibacterium stellerae]|uniref:hypothetical protein n=1 Tax=Mycolicibacterium stellerae TaxID=2358193 RepID=UPI000F0B2F77|nr:hypothetical protein [Mycolicibacterium stellerae]